MARKAAFHNLGCRVNEYEAQAMAEELRQAGYEIVPFAPGADVYVINTCTVTNVADRKSRQMLHKAREMNPDAAVVAAGCYVEDARTRLDADPAVDILVGNNDKSRLPAILAAWFEDREAARQGGAAGCAKGCSAPGDASDGPGAASERLSAAGELTAGAKAGPVRRSRAGSDRPHGIGSVHGYEPLEISETEGHTRAYIKIQDGCNQFCTYCMIPYVRGRVRSRTEEDAVREADRLSRAGHREIVLTGIHISSYGLDFDMPGVNRQTPDAAEAVTNERLLALIRRIAALPFVERVRLGSLEPGIMTEKFVRELGEIPEICPQFHLSLQSGCDETLSRMRRKYDTGAFREKVLLLRRVFDRPAVTTDIITGFPGETDAEFARTYDFVSEMHFAKTHVFKYSRRDGTRAAAMPDQVPEEIKHKRSLALIGLDRKRRMAYASSFAGRDVEALFEEIKSLDGKIVLAGHTREALAVAAQPGAAAPGDIRKVKVKDVLAGGVLLV